MKHRHLMIPLLAALSLTVAGTASAGDRRDEALIGGAVGGALGAFIGSDHGRDGAIIGSALGAAAGTAIATDGYRGRDHGGYDRRVIVRHPKRHSRYRDDDRYDRYDRYDRDDRHRWYQGANRPHHRKGWVRGRGHGPGHGYYRHAGRDWKHGHRGHRRPGARARIGW